jgi:hypothetical protein
MQGDIKMTNKMPENHPNSIGERLAARFMVEKYSGGQRSFYDRETGQQGLQPMHLIGVAMTFGVADLEEAKQIVKLQYFRPLSPAIVYRPNQPDIVSEKGLNSRNSWRVPEVMPEPTKSAQRFIDHLQDVLGADDGKVDYLLDMLSYRYQNPTAPKPHIAFYFFGEQGGAGKSTFAETLTKVFGSTAVRTTNTVAGLTGKGSVDLWGRTFLIVEEASLAKGTALYDEIKSYTGSDYTDTDRKYAAVGTHHIPAQLFMLSNRPPMFLEPEDRRFFVARWQLSIIGAEERAAYFAEYRQWLNSGGLEAIAGLFNTRKIAADPYRNAPETTEKITAIECAIDPTVAAIRDWLKEHESIRLITMQNLDEIWVNHGTKMTARKHKMVEAGLQFYGRTKLGDKQYSVYQYKEDVVIPACYGHGLSVRLADGSCRYWNYVFYARLDSF